MNYAIALCAIRFFFSLRGMLEQKAELSTEEWETNDNNVVSAVKMGVRLGGWGTAPTAAAG